MFLQIPGTLIGRMQGNSLYPLRVAAKHVLRNTKSTKLQILAELFSVLLGVLVFTSVSKIDHANTELSHLKR